MKILMFDTTCHSIINTRMNDDGEEEIIDKESYSDEDLKNIIDVTEEEEYSLGRNKQYINGKFVDYTSPIVYENEIEELNKWFEFYDNQIVQYNRAVRLGLEYDNKYGTIEELDTKATENAKRISELKTILKNNYHYDI